MFILYGMDHGWVYERNVDTGSALNDVPNDTGPVTFTYAFF
jgi:hypothetical protein